jgi:hypothetical protein
VKDCLPLSKTQRIPGGHLWFIHVTLSDCYYLAVVFSDDPASAKLQVDFKAPRDFGDLSSEFSVISMSSRFATWSLSAVSKLCPRLQFLIQQCAGISTGCSHLRADRRGHDG